MSRLAAAVRALTGWRRALLAVLAGLAAAFALPPFHAVPLLWPAFAVLFWLVEGARRWPAALAAGWLFGLGHFGFGFYWVANALLVEPDRFGWLYPVIWLAMGGGFAGYTALVALAHRLLGWHGVAGAFAFAALWSGGEFLRGWLFTGFPWNLLGTVWAFAPQPMQGAAVIGLYGLSAVTALAAVLPAAWAGARPRWGGWAGAAALVALMFGHGALRLHGVPAADAPANATPTVVRMVQPAIAQAEKWAEGGLAAVFLRTLQLSRAPGLERVALVVWPETAIPFPIESEPRGIAMLAESAPAGGALVAGSVRVRRDGATRAVWNSLFAFDRTGGPVAGYDKFHLVPFGEFVPLRALDWFRLTEGLGDFSAGPGPRTLTLPGLPPFAALICYEVIFPAAVVEPGTRPAFMLNLTNDAWYGHSPGPYQHLVAARFRAVEEGLPLVRSANNGISAMLDGYGRVVAALPLGPAGVLDAPLPPPLATTLFAAHGNLLPGLLAFLFGLCALALRNRRFVFG